MYLIFPLIVVIVSLWQISHSFVFPDQLDELKKSLYLHKALKMEEKESKHTINAAQVTGSSVKNNNHAQNRASKRISEKSESVLSKLNSHQKQFVQHSV